MSVRPEDRGRQSLNLLGSKGFPSDSLQNILGRLPPWQYLQVCSEREGIREQIAPYQLENHMRYYAMQNFVVVAKTLSRVQMVDLMHDPQLPWSDTKVLEVAQAWEQAHPKEESLLSQYTPCERLVQYFNIDWSHYPACEIATTSSWHWRTVKESWGEYLLSKAQMSGINLWRPSDDVVMRNFAPDVRVLSFLVLGDALYIGDKVGVVRVFDLHTGVLHTQWRCTFAPKPVLHMKCGGEFFWVGSSTWHSADVEVYRATGQVHSLSGVLQGLKEGTTLVAASPSLGFGQVPVTEPITKPVTQPVEGDEVVEIHAWNPVTAEKVGSISLGWAPYSVANLRDRVLCVAVEEVVHAYRMDASLEHLWTVRFDRPFEGMEYKCLAPRGDFVVYTSSWWAPTRGNCGILAVLDEKGNIVHEENNNLKILQIVNTQQAIYVSAEKWQSPGQMGSFYCLRA